MAEVLSFGNSIAVIALRGTWLLGSYGPQTVSWGTADQADPNPKMTLDPEKNVIQLVADPEVSGYVG